MYKTYRAPKEPKVAGIRSAAQARHAQVLGLSSKIARAESIPKKEAYRQAERIIEAEFGPKPAGKQVRHRKEQTPAQLRQNRTLKLANEIAKTTGVSKKEAYREAAAELEATEGPRPPRKNLQEVMAELPPVLAHAMDTDPELAEVMHQVMSSPVVLATAIDDYNNGTENLPAVVDGVIANPEEDVYLPYLFPEYEGEGFFDNLLDIGKSVGKSLLKNVVATGLNALTGSALPVSKRRGSAMVGGAMVGGYLSGGALLGKYGRSYDGEMRKIGLAYNGGFLAPLLGSLASGLFSKLF